MMMFMILFGNILTVFCMTCDQYLELPEDNAVWLPQLKTLQPNEMIQCLTHIGREKMPKAEAEYIWQTIITYYGGISEIPENTLRILRWVSTALTPADLANITFDSIDIVQNFGLNYGLGEEQMEVIANKVRIEYAGKEPEDYTFYDLTALRQILCYFNQSEIERIRPKAYREAAMLIGKLENCKDEVMEGFASLAVQPEAFGAPGQWSRFTVKAVGKVAEYFPNGTLPQYNQTVTMNPTVESSKGMI